MWQAWHERPVMDIDMAQLNAVVQSLTHKTVFGQLETYVPHPKQEPFHRAADVKERWFLAGNRSGKTFACCVEDIWWVTGTHPCFQPIAERSRDDLFWANLRMTWDQNGWGKAPEPEDWPYVKWPGGQIQWRAMCSDEGIMESTLIPVYRKMIPTFMLACLLCGTSKGGPGHIHTPSWDSAYMKSKNTIRFSEKYNMGFIELKTYQQYKNNPYSHDSVTLTGVHADEEPPEGCYKINHGRLVSGDTDFQGVFIGSLTPVNPSEYIVTDIVEASQDNPRKKIFEMEIHDNPHLSKQVIKDFLDLYTDPAERLSREKGIPGYYQNKIYPEYDQRHFIEIPKQFFTKLPEYSKTIIIDPHDSKPHAVLWMAWDTGTEEPTCYSYREMQMNGTVDQLCTNIRAASEGEQIDVMLIDRSVRRTQQLLDEDASIDHIFEQFKLYFPDIVPVGGKGTYSIRTEKLRQMLVPGNMTGLPNFFVLKCCPTLDWQMRHLHRKPNLPGGEERPYFQKFKKNDDVSDCAEYGIQYGPPEAQLFSREAVVAGFSGYAPIDGRPRVI